MDESHLAVGAHHSVLDIEARATPKRFRHGFMHVRFIFGVNQFRQLG
jgi:hypothetical protein